MKQAREKVTKLILDKRDQEIDGQRYSAIDYNDVRFWGGTYRDCEWADCKFNKSSFANGIVFENCRFVRSSFLSAHTSLRAFFKGCSFDDCVFKGPLVDGSRFEDCSFSGAMKDMIFFGKGVKSDRSVLLRNVDMRGVVFDMTDFRLGVDLSSTQFGAEPGTLFIEGKPHP